MTDVLSKDDIDKLLQAVNTSTSQSASTSLASITPTVINTLRIYDFKRPTVYSKQQIRKHCDILNLCCPKVSEHLNETVDFNLAIGEQTTTKEFLRMTKLPCYLFIFVITNKSVEIGHFYLTMSSQAATNIISTLLKQNKLHKGIAESPLKILLLKEFAKVFSNELYNAYKIIDPTISIEIIADNVYYGQPERKIMSIEPESSINFDQGLYFLINENYSTDKIINNNLCFEGPEESLSLYYPKKVADFFCKKEIKNSEKSIGITTYVKKEINVSFILKEEMLFEIFNLKIDDILFMPKKVTIRDNQLSLMEGSVQKNLKTITITKVLEVPENYMKKNILQVDAISKINVTLAAELGRKEMTIGEIQKLHEGSIVELDTIAGEPMNIFADNALIGKGEVIIADDNFAIRVVELYLNNGSDLPDD